jgi:hypothetical protein
MTLLPEARERPELLVSLSRNVRSEMGDKKLEYPRITTDMLLLALRLSAGAPRRRRPYVMYGCFSGREHKHSQGCGERTPSIILPERLLPRDG